MYVIVFFNKYDQHSIDVTIGPFDDLAAAQQWVRDNTDGTHRFYATEKLRMELPEWAR